MGAKLTINAHAKECLTYKGFGFFNGTLININICMYPLISMQKSQHQLIKQYANNHTA